MTHMKNRKLWVRIGSVALLASMLLSATGCGKEESVISIIPTKKEEAVTIEPMEQEEVYTLGFDALGGDEVMPIAGYYGPIEGFYSFDGQSLPDYITDEMFQKIADCGVNLLHSAHVDYAYYPKASKKVLDLGEKYNLGVCVWDSQIMNTTSPLSLKAMDEKLNEYRDHPAFCGVYVVDEPGSDDYMQGQGEQHSIKAFAPIFQNLKQLDTFGYGNLFPVWQNDKYDEYELYVDEWCSKAQPMYLSFDIYPFDEGIGSVYYFNNLDVIRRYAEKYELPFWCYIQAGGQWVTTVGERVESKPYYPTEGQLLWNVNTSLAYGTKGIQYFPLIQPYYYAFAESVDVDSHRNGLIGLMGNKTQWWYYAQRANKQIAAIDEVLMKSVNKGVIVSGKQAAEDTKGLGAIMEGTEWRELKGVEGDAMIGCFNYQGKTALYVVNYDWDYAQKITLNLQDTYKLSITQEAEESKVETNKLILDLKAGEGALVVFDDTTK